MKATIRIVLGGAAALAMVLAAWSAVSAEKNSSAADGASISQLLAPMLHLSSKSSDVQADVPTTTETPQVAEDHADDQRDQQEAQATPEATEAPESADDHSSQGDAIDTPEAHNAEVTGVVSAIDGTSVTINGQVFRLSGQTEGDKAQVGDTVKLEFVTNSDGSVSVREIQSAEQSGNSGDSNRAGHDSRGDQQGDNSGSHSGGHDGGGSGDSGGGNSGGDGG